MLVPPHTNTRLQNGILWWASLKGGGWRQGPLFALLKKELQKKKALRTTTANDKKSKSWIKAPFCMSPTVTRIEGDLGWARHNVPQTTPLDSKDGAGLHCCISGPYLAVSVNLGAVLFLSLGCHSKKSPTIHHRSILKPESLVLETWPHEHFIGTTPPRVITRALRKGHESIRGPYADCDLALGECKPLSSTLSQVAQCRQKALLHKGPRSDHAEVTPRGAVDFQSIYK